jgi:hypothetical protein
LEASCRPKELPVAKRNFLLVIKEFPVPFLGIDIEIWQVPTPPKWKFPGGQELPLF